MNSLNFNHYLSVSTIVKIWNRLFLNDSFNLFCSILKRQLKEDFKIYKLITISNVQNCFYHFQFQNIYYWVWKRKRLRNRAYYFNRFICGFIYIYIKYFHCCMKYIEIEPRTNKKWIYILKINVFNKFFGVECIAAAIIKIDNLGGNLFFFWTNTIYIDCQQPGEIRTEQFYEWFMGFFIHENKYTIGNDERTQVKLWHRGWIQSIHEYSTKNHDKHMHFIKYRYVYLVSIFIIDD